ncbi:MAG: MlaC/ttg2D family ABC transporter substrate-binding protein [Candidatus Eutrophobiaceae bacterium]
MNIAFRTFIPSALLFAFLLQVVEAADFKTPIARVEDSITQVVRVLRDKSMEREQRWSEIATIIRSGFDFRSMSQSVLATNWKAASPDEQQQFSEYFSQYMEEVYRSRIEAYTDEEIRYVGETITGKRAVVKTEIITATAIIPVHYRLKKNKDGNWYAYDVIIEGVSLISNYRNTFAAIVKNEGMDGLLGNLKRKIDKHHTRRQ